MHRTKIEMLQEVAEQYRTAGQAWPATARMIAGWAIGGGLWKPSRESLISQAARELADALREEYFTDPQGRRVRKKHVFRQRQEMFWADIEDAEPKQMEMAFALRRKQILGDCHQLKTDADSFNQNNKYGATIQMLFDFREDLAELEQPAHYAGIA